MEKRKKSMKVNMVLNSIKGIMGIIFPLISFPYISKTLGVTNIGRYNFSASIVSYFVMFSMLGINTYAIRELSKIRDKKEEVNKVASELFSINLFSSAISYICLAVCLIFFDKLYYYRICILILSTQILFNAFGIEWVFSTFEDFLYITVRSIIFQVISIFLLLLFVRNANDLYIYAFISVFASVGANTLNFIHARKYCIVRFLYRTSIKKHIKPIIMLFATILTTTVYVNSDITVLGFMTNDYCVGVYSTATKMYTVVKRILSSVIIVSIPKLAALTKDKDAFKEAADEVYKLLITVTIPAIVGIIGVRRQLISLLTTKEFIEANTSLLILAIALFFCLGAWFWGQCVLVTNNFERTLLKATVWSALINLVLNILLIPIWKEKAAAITTLISEGLVFFICRYKGRSIICLNGILKELCKVILGCIPIVILTCFLPIYVKSDILCVSIAIACSVPLYFLIEYFVRNETVNATVKSVKNKVNKRMAI